MSIEIGPGRYRGSETMHVDFYRFLTLRKGMLVTRDEIAREFQYDAHIDPYNNVGWHVFNLRKKLLDGERVYTLHARGITLLDEKEEGCTHSFPEVWPDAPPDDELVQFATTAVLQEKKGKSELEFVLPFTQDELCLLDTLLIGCQNNTAIK